jgi:hypothetical protein
MSYGPYTRTPTAAIMAGGITTTTLRTLRGRWNAGRGSARISGLTKRSAMSDEGTELAAPSGSALPVDDIILTEPDINLCLGSQELLRCPFCGSDAMSHGEKTPNGTAICWKITCLSLERGIPNCTASVWETNRDQAKARAGAVRKWNRRPNVV